MILMLDLYEIKHWLYVSFRLLCKAEIAHEVYLIPGKDVCPCYTNVRKQASVGCLDLFQEFFILGKSQGSVPLIFSLNPIPGFSQEIRAKDPGTDGTVTAEKENPADRIVFIPAQPFLYTITLLIVCSDEHTDRWRKSHHKPYPK